MTKVPSAVLETAHVIWPGARHLGTTRDPRPAPGARDYALLPRAAAPRWLLPADAPGTADALVGQESGRLRQGAVRALALAHRTGLTHRLPVSRLRVVGGHEDSLVTAIEGMLEPDVALAIRLGAWSHARSVVVRAFDRAGTTVAFGKVGIDAHGRAAVRAESRNLSRATALGLRHVVHSEVLRHEQWRGLDVLLVSPLLPSTDPGPGQEMPVEAMLELAHSEVRTAPLTESAWWTGVQGRLADVADPVLRDELAGAAARLGGAGAGTSLALGPWHGDWTPWNMARQGLRVLLWDWEHFDEDVPVGFDLVHHLAQELRVSTGTDEGAESVWRRRADDALARHVGLDPAQRDVVLVAYLLEVNLRFVLDRQGTPQSGARRAGWGLPLLRLESQRLASTR